jgi:class 3 adenylate cyclase
MGEHRMSTEASVPRRKLSAILMVDVSGFSRMMGRDEEGTTRLIREFHERTKSLVESHQGRVVDTAGDSVFGEFDSVVNAVRCAQAIQDAQAGANASRSADERIETRIGVHLGDVIVQDYNVYGDGVNIAARLQAIAHPGSICVSEAVYQQVQGKLELAFDDLGVQTLKNIEHPVRLYEARLGGSQGPRKEEAPKAPRVAQSGATWLDALLHPSSLVPLLVGAYLLATALGLPPSGRAYPAAGAIVLGVGVGRLLRLRTGRRAFFLMALGAGLIGASALWTGPRPELITLAGAIVIVVGLTKLRA